MRVYALVLSWLAAAAVLLAGCGGGGNDGAKVEASLQHYLSTLDPQACLGSRSCTQGVFPLSHGKSAVPVAVAVKRGGEVYMANPMSQAAPPPPATTYEGGP